MAWVLAGAAGLALALVQYGRARGHAWAPALCRWGAATTLTALALDAPAGRASSLRPFAALDVSASWHRARGIGPDADGYRRALAAIAAARPESLFLVGDSLRVTPPPASPTDNRSRIRPAIDRAAAAGRALVLVTDGEIDDPEALDALPAGSEIKVIATPEGSDAALVGVDAPRTAIAGDTITVHAAVAAGSAGAGAGHLTLRLDDALQASIPLPAMAPYGEQRVEARVSVSGTNGARVLRAIVTAAGDVEPRNDTVGIALDVAPAVGAVFVSTSPDEDARYALSVLRGTLALPTRAFFRVSPGNWRQEGTLAAASEEEVRRAVGLAPLVVLHGDTAVFGAPRTVTRGGLALVVPPAPGGTRGESDEWYATSAPPSPISAALHAVPWDSLAPIDVGEIAPINAAANGGGGAWAALEARRARRFEPRVAVAGSERNGRRAVIVAASGLWRWRVRGGPTRAARREPAPPRSRLCGAGSSIGSRPQRPMIARRFRQRGCGGRAIPCNGGGDPAPTPSSRSFSSREGGGNTDARTRPSPASSAERRRRLRRRCRRASMTFGSAEAPPSWSSTPRASGCRGVPPPTAAGKARSRSQASCPDCAGSAGHTLWSSSHSARSGSCADGWDSDDARDARDARDAGRGIAGWLDWIRAPGTCRAARSGTASRTSPSPT